MAVMALFSLFMMANPISPTQALSKARLMAGKRLAGKPTDIKIAYQTKRATGEPCLYIVNMGHGGGFVVLSGDDSTEEIIGYSDSGDFDAEQMPDNMREWLEQWTTELDATLSADISQNSRPLKAKAQNVHPTDVVEPLLTTHWGQGAPYNKYSPTINGVLSPTGCTATAMAQLMYFHRHPTGNTTSIPSYVTTTAKQNIPQLPATSFNWDLMTPEVTEDSPEEVIDEVARLMVYSGHSVNMDYKENTSSSYVYDVPKSLTKYFGYANTMHYVLRESYDIRDWDNLLVNELKNNRPVIYFANTNINAGHAFICDGYDGKGFFHINWGWLGAGDGYYLLTAAHAKGEGLNPNVKNYHLTLFQAAVIGIQAQGEDGYVFPAEGLRAFSRPSLKNGRTYTRADNKSAFTDITLKQSVVNTLAEQKAFFHSFGLFDDTGLLVSELKPSSTTSTFSVYGNKDLELLSASFGANISEGHYTIKAIYRGNKSEEWKLMGGTDKNYVDVVIDGTQLTLTPVPKADFTVNALWIDNSFLHIDFDNNDEEFFGPIYLRKYNSKTKAIVEVCHDDLSVVPQAHMHYELFIPDGQTLNLTKDRFYLSVDEYDTQYFYTNDNATQANLSKRVDIYNLDDDLTTIVGDRLMGRLVVSNNGKTAYEGVVKFNLGDKLDNITPLWSDTVSIASGDSIVIPIEQMLDGTDEFRILSIHQTGNYSWSCDSTDVYDVAKGAIYWTKTGEMSVIKSSSSTFQVPEDALAIILANSYTKDVKPNNNPNTIYMLNTTMPKSLKETNYVDGSGQGRDLILTDGYDYLIPREMTFGKVTYSRELSDSDSLVWTTIALPFKPDEIKADDESITPRVTEQDIESHLRILEMTGVNDTIVATSFITELEAYTPYLMAYDTILVGKTLTFEAQKCTVSPTIADSLQVVAGNYTLHGTHVGNSLTNIYTFDGNRLRHNEEECSVAPFRAYLTGSSSDSPKLLAIDIDNPIPEIPFEKLPGDANIDSSINIADIMLIVRYIMEENPEPFNEINADYDGNGIIDINDVTATITDILGGEDKGAKPQTEETPEESDDMP